MTSLIRFFSPDFPLIQKNLLIWYSIPWKPQIQQGMKEASDAYKVLAVSYVKPNRKSPFLSLRRGALTYDLVSCQEYFFSVLPQSQFYSGFLVWPFLCTFSSSWLLLECQDLLRRLPLHQVLEKENVAIFLEISKVVKGGLLNTTLGKISSKSDNFYSRKFYYSTNWKSWEQNWLFIKLLRIMNMSNLVQLNYKCFYIYLKWRFLHKILFFF